MLREKLDDFLLYFQRYLLCKPFLPSHIEFTVLDVYDNLEQFAMDELRRSLKSLTTKEKEKDGVKGGGKRKGKDNADIKALKEKLLKPSSCFVRCTTYQEAESLIIAREEKKQEDFEKTRKRISAYYSKNATSDGNTVISSLSTEGGTSEGSLETKMGELSHGGTELSKDDDVNDDGEDDDGEDDDDDDDDDEEDDEEDDYRRKKEMASTDDKDDDDEDEEEEEGKGEIPRLHGGAVNIRNGCFNIYSLHFRR
jgi:hypothetical protein